MHYFPLAWPFLVGLLFLVFVLVALVELGILKYAYAHIGIPPRYVLTVLLLSLVGSAIQHSGSAIPARAGSLWLVA
jgi:uncharacterized membrane protein